MYACLYAPGSSPAALLDLALEFSPYVEQSSGDTVIFCIDPLRKLLGSPYQIASEISRAGYERSLQAHLAIASNPDTAILLARHTTGVTLIPPGEEQRKLAPLSLAELTTDQAMLDLLLRWGVKSCEDLAVLPEAGVAERLGPGGVYLRNLSLGVLHRPLRISAETSNYERRVVLEHPIVLLEPLLFLFSSALAEICSLLRSQSRAARQLAISMDLEGAKGAAARRQTAKELSGISGGALDTAPVLREFLQNPGCATVHPPAYRAVLEFPVPLTDHRTMLKLLQLHLERHPPEAQIVAFQLRVEPVAPRRVQNGLFLPATPLPDKLQITLARIAGMLGEENVGSPQRLNTHRPDAFRMVGLNFQFESKAEDVPQGEMLRLVIRIFRPALEARVRLVELAPKEVRAAGVKGTVMRSAGPWKTSGEWWADTAWSRDEWDVALDDGGLYRIYQEAQTQGWFVQGVYD
jgi:protein ImuB